MGIPTEARLYDERNGNLRRAQQRGVLQSMRPRRAVSNSKPLSPPGDWKGRLRVRQTTGVAQKSSSPAKKRKLPEDESVPAPKKAKREPVGSYSTRTEETEAAPLTEGNLKLLTMENPPVKSTALSSVLSTTSTRAYGPSNPLFEVELENAGVVMIGFEQPAKGGVERIRAVMERERGSPEPDQELFHQTRVVVQRENESAIVAQLSPLLLEHRNIPRNNDKTQHLLYRDDTPWAATGSSRPGLLPVPKPDLCLSYLKSAFDPSERAQMASPYIDDAGFAPFLVFEVKTALQGDQIANRQNANNVLAALKADFALQEKIGQAGAAEGRIRVIAGAHNTRNMWIDGWFWRRAPDGGPPRWCKCFVDLVNYEDPAQNGYVRARAWFLNLAEDGERRLRALRADLARAAPADRAPPPSASGHGGSRATSPSGAREPELGAYRSASARRPAPPAMHAPATPQSDDRVGAAERPPEQRRGPKRAKKRATSGPATRSAGRPKRANSK